MRRRWYITRREIKALAIIFGIGAVIALIILIIKGISMLETWAIVLIVVAIVLAILIPIVIKIISKIKRKKYLEEKRKHLNQEWITKNTQNVNNLKEDITRRTYNKTKYEKKSIEDNKKDAGR